MESEIEYSRLLEKNWDKLNDEIDTIANEFGTTRPKIIAVSKTRSMDEILAAYDIGIRDFGENYAQELETKAMKLPKANWHFIGHLQRGNAKLITPFTIILHTLDSEKLATRLSNLNFKGKILIQIKISQDLSKFGMIAEFDKIQELIHHCNSLNLTVEGLMGIGGLNWNEDQILDEYTKLSDLNNQLGLKQLSLGMSNDYQIAIKAGSTMIRVGTKIFGPRT